MVAGIIRVLTISNHLLQSAPFVVYRLSDELPCYTDSDCDEAALLKEDECLMVSAMSFLSH